MRILVTGAAHWLGGTVVRHLERRDGVVVYAVGGGAPCLSFTSDFRAVAIDGLDFAHHLLDVAPHAVIHTQPQIDEDDGIVAGTETLLGAVARSPATRLLVVTSDSAVYGAGHRHPSILGERSELRGDEARQRRLAAVERLVAEAAHDDVTHIVLRLAPIFGGEVGNAISRFLSLPVVPTVLGFDPRIQLLGERDAVAAVLHAVDRPSDGTFNVAALGQLYLSRILRLGQRVPQPLPRPVFTAALRGLRRLDLDVSPHLAALLEHGRVMDTREMTSRLGFAPTMAMRDVVIAGYRRLEKAA